MKAHFCHFNFNVLDLERSMAFYEEALDLREVRRITDESFVIVYLGAGQTDFTLELTWLRERTRPYDLGDGYGHLAVSVADLDAEHARLTAEGLSPLPVKELALGARVVGRFFFIVDPDGYRIEVLQRGAPGRFL